MKAGQKGLEGLIVDAVTARPAPTLERIAKMCAAFASSLPTPNPAALVPALSEFIGSLSHGSNAQQAAEQFTAALANAQVADEVRIALVGDAQRLLADSKQQLTALNKRVASGATKINPGKGDKPPVAVFIDGSALFLASRNPDNRRLGYPALIEVLARELGIPRPLPFPYANGTVWSMWTAADSTNTGQQKFIDFAESSLNWLVRPEAPHAAYMVLPEDLLGPGAQDFARGSRLLRFDASISFAIGRLAETHRIVVLSDSWSLHGPLATVAENWATKNGPPVLAFFGAALDHRWRTLRSGESDLQILDLDDFYSELFEQHTKETRAIKSKPGDLIF